MSISQSNAFPSDPITDFRHRSLGPNLSSGAATKTNQTGRRTITETLQRFRKPTPGSHGDSSESTDSQPDARRRGSSRKTKAIIAGVGVGSIATTAGLGLAHMNEIVTLVRDWGPGIVVVVLIFLLLFNAPMQWSKFKNEQEDRRERKELSMAMLDMQGRTTEALVEVKIESRRITEAVGEVRAEIRSNTTKIDQLVMALSSRACLATVPQLQEQIVEIETEHPHGKRRKT